jgi:hypothetical protein
VLYSYVLDPLACKAALQHALNRRNQACVKYKKNRDAREKETVSEQLFERGDVCSGERP